MTRINTHVPIIDEHLRAARIEYCRIPNSVLKYFDGDCMETLHRKLAREQPLQYTVRTNDNPAGGKGHMLFFFDKLMFVEQQYRMVLAECGRRGFVNDDWWPADRMSDIYQFNRGWLPSYPDITLCKTRQIERIPKNPHIYGHVVTREEAELAIIADRLPRRITEALHAVY